MFLFRLSYFFYYHLITRQDVKVFFDIDFYLYAAEIVRVTWIVTSFGIGF